MKLKVLLPLATILMIVQYLLISQNLAAVLLPEMGIVVLVISRQQLDTLGLVAFGLYLGYLGDILGVVDRGSILLGYLFATAWLVVLSKFISIPQIAERFLAISGALIVFHGTLAVMAGPVHFSDWLTVVIIQIVGASLMLQFNVVAQRVWRPAV